MKLQQQSERKSRTRTLIAAGGLLKKSGILEVFRINSGEDLQAYENREKVAALLGFLIECFEKNEFDDNNLEQWEAVGARMVRGD